MNLDKNLENKCRICAVDIFDNTSVYIFGDLYLEERIRKYLYITVTETDELPKIICGSCFNKLEGIYKFSCLALKTEENYLTYISRLKYNQENITSKSCDDNFSKLLRPNKTKIRNSRHNEHKSLEQIINDKIVKNFRTNSTTIGITPETTINLIEQHQFNDDLSIISYNDLKLGQVIKDHELLQLIMKALKWNGRLNDQCNEINVTEMDELKNTSFHKVLTNTNLLNNEDLMQLIKSYIGVDGFDYGAKQKPFNRMDDNSNESITEIEIGVDPNLFLPYDDEELRTQSSTTESSTATFVVSNLESEKVFLCSNCTAKFTTHVQLQEHVLMTHLIKKATVKVETTKVSKISTRNSMRNISSSVGTSTGGGGGGGEGTTFSGLQKKTIGRKRLRVVKNKFECIICNKKLSTKGNLKVHMDTHKPKGKYTCEKCGRIFKSIINLLRHKEYHTDIQFKCNICHRVYPSNSTLKAHSVTHSTERPHICSICDKTFKRNQDLKFHLNQHTGERPFQCQYCPKTFASSGNCFSHRKRMHPDEVD